MAIRATERQHDAAKGLQSVAPSEALTRLLDAQIAASVALWPALPALEAAAAMAADALRRGGRLGYAGAGSSGLMALADGLELAGTYGIAPDRTPILFAGGAQALLHMEGQAEDDPALARTDLAASGLADGDALICVSASGGTPYTLAVAKLAHARGVNVIGIANVAGSALLEIADVAILLDTGPEVIAGSTRMAAGTAQKIALNLISTAMALRLGHVQDGYMVNLTADNAKLRERARRIVMSVSGVPDAQAEAALAAAGGQVKTAILLAAGARNATEAAGLLAAHDGHLGPALTKLAARTG